MGVINITPNSFSDGGKYQTPKDVLSEVSEMSPDIVDVGAESTAPFNDPISFGEEIERFRSYLYPIVDEMTIPLSIDTYRFETIERVIADLKRPLIWNDVSGCDFKQVLQLLKKHKNLSYVFSHNLVPERSQTSDHMKYVNDNLQLSDVSNFFSEVKSLSSELKERIYLDPCFGFSKTREQNYQLFWALTELMHEYSEFKWLIGISRKSFLRFNKLDRKNPRSIAEAEVAQVILFDWLFRKLPADISITIRMHDPQIFNVLAQLEI